MERVTEVSWPSRRAAESCRSNSQWRDGAGSPYAFSCWYMYQSLHITINAALTVNR